MAKGDVTLEIGGDATGLMAALAQAREATESASESMQSAMSRVTSAFSTVNTAMAAFAAVLAGGKAFKASVDASVETASAAAALGRQMGITATQASVLRVAMDENHVSAEAMSAGANKIATTLRTNESAFTKLGVATRDSNGNFRDSFDIMQDVNTKLGEVKEGTDRNVEGQKIYGRGWADIAQTLRITEKAMDEAKDKADALGLTVGAEGLAQVKEYRTTMAGVGEVFEGVKKAIGDALLPYLTQLGQWFESIGPQAVEVIKGAMVGLIAVVQSVWVVIVAFFNGVMLAWEEFVALFNTLSSVLDRAMHFDFKGAQKAWTDGWDQMVQIAKTRIGNVSQAMDSASSGIADAAGRAFGPQTPTTQRDGAASSGQVSKDSRMSEWEATLAERKSAFEQEQLAEGSFRDFSKEQELEYWKDILATTSTSLQEKRALREKIANDETSIAKQGFEAQLAQLKDEEAAHKNNTSARLAIEQEYSDKVKLAYGEDSKQYADAQRAIIQTKRQAIEQQQQLDQIRATSIRSAAQAEISIQEQSAKEQYDMHAISLQQYIAQLQEFENRKYQIEQAALQQQLALIDPREDPVKVAQINAQLEQLELQHSQAMAKIQKQSTAEVSGYYKQFYSSMQSGFQSAITGMLNGTQTFAQGIRNLFKSILDAIIGVLAQIAATWLANAIMERLIGKTTAVSQIAANASIAATAAMASVAAIPIVGWAMAPGVGAATYATAMAYNASLSAAGGFDVPASVNPVTQLHQREMVLPAKYADVIRGMSDGTGQGGGQSAAGDVHLHVHAMDGDSVKRLLLGNKHALAGVMRGLVRDGHLKAPK